MAVRLTGDPLPDVDLTGGATWLVSRWTGTPHAFARHAGEAFCGRLTRADGSSSLPPGQPPCASCGSVLGLVELWASTRGRPLRWVPGRAGCQPDVAPPPDVD